MLREILLTMAKSKNKKKQSLSDYLKQLFGNEHDLVITSIILGVSYVTQFDDPTYAESVFKKIATFYASEVESKKMSDEIKEKIKTFLNNLEKEVEADAEASHMASF